MSKISRICKWCEKEFLVEKREVNRGGGIFCSISCSTLSMNSHREAITKVCTFCEREYQTTSVHSLYCSKTCNRKARSARTVKSGNKNTNRSILQKRILRKIGPEEFKCFLCNWNDEMCDVHHITSKSAGGSDSLDNLSVLCPNHHRLADRGKLISLPSVSERYRTISSSK